MTLNEFRAWFDGFSEAIGDAPTPEQWARIKAKVAETQERVVVPSSWPSATQPMAPYAPPHSIPAWTGPRLGEVTCVSNRDALSTTIARN